ncbi:uncharacterized protein LOC110026654 [Phalaenopsis equestris]|uniref:uncharacterized protein LOC110026654 n=1 Tax=Phalaenopsis equestris TaxID=78828 RepID=UPI0009E2C31F|nr:uncharacterized protein LOC110026654 [Phalaenopsis equestris]
MAGSFSMEEFLGDGVLKELIPKFVEAGWDDVPTLKMKDYEDMHGFKLTQQQKDALELRKHLHDKCLMKYADKMEASKVSLQALLSMSNVALSSQFKMKKADISRFFNNENNSSCANESCNGNINGSKKADPKLSSNFDAPNAKTTLHLKLNEGHIFKGVVSAKPTGSKLYGCIRTCQIVEDVAPYSSLANITVERRTSEYKVGVQSVAASNFATMKASEMWKEKAVVLLCIRRPGCIMCRAEAHRLYSRKPIFDALGIQLVAVLHEHIESEVREFWPRYWGGVVVIDQNMGFFKAFGGGRLLKDRFLTGFVLNSEAKANYRAAKATGLEGNYRGERHIKGGMFIVRRGRGGIAYQFIERNFGDWAPIAEVVEICNRIKNEL